MDSLDLSVDPWFMQNFSLGQLENTCPPSCLPYRRPHPKIKQRPLAFFQMAYDIQDPQLSTFGKHWPGSKRLRQDPKVDAAFSRMGATATNSEIVH